MAEEVTNSGIINKQWMDEYDTNLKAKGLTPLYERTLTPTLASAPTSSTLTYTKDNKTYAFKIGDECRVADQVNASEGSNGYVYYKLYDLVTENGSTTAYWALSGSGSGESAMARITVSLEAYVNDAKTAGSDLSGLTVTLTNTTDQTTVATQQWAGTPVTFRGLVPLKDYSVSVQSKSGYTAPAAQAVTAIGIGEEVTKTFTYEADEYTIATNQGGSTVTVLSTAYGNGQTFRVAKGTSIGTPTASYVKGYSVSVTTTGKTITAAYSTTPVTIGIQSNQTSDQTIAALQATVAWTYDGHSESETAADGQSINVPTGVTPTVTFPAAPTGYSRSVSGNTATYTTMRLTVSVAADEGTPDLSGVAVVVTDTTTSATVPESSVSGTYLIPGGHGYSVSITTAIDGYTTPAAQTGTAGTGADASASVTLEYAYNPIMYAYVTFNQTQSGDTAIIDVKDTQNGTALTCPTTSGATHPNAAIQAIRDASHLYLGNFANGKMTLRQLQDGDGTKYLDGTTAALDGTEGDHWLRIGIDFYVKRVSGSDSGDTVTYGIAVGGQPDSTWKQIITPNDLLGVHEAIASDTGNNTSGVLYSKSGSASSASISQANFRQKARNKGTGFSIVTWEWHCVMALLFYAWYGRANCQAQCGTGSSSYTRTLGTKDSLGMTDTTSSNGNADNTKFWGIENWWGDKYEWVDNVAIQDRVWTVNDIDGSAKRTGMTAGNADGWITKLMLTENLDLIPTAASGGSETTYYCDYYWQSSGSRVVARSVHDASTYGGVACVYANYGSSDTYTSIGSRLAFSGTIEIV